MLALAAALVLPRGAAAQQAWREVQLWGVATTSRPAMYGGGLGLAFRDRGRTRIGTAVAAGATEDGDPAGRVEIAWHFLLDPARRSGIGVYGGGGLAMTVSRGRHLKPWIQAAVGIEANPGSVRGVFLEAGFGGGARVAAGLRFRRRH